MLRSLLRKGLVDLITANFLMQFVGFGLLILLPRLVSEAEVGQIKVLQTYIDLLVIVAGLGMNTAVLKLCADRRPDAEREGLLRRAVIGTLAASGGLYLVVVALSLSGVVSRDPVIARWLPVYALAIPFSAVTLVAVAYLQARKKIREMARAQMLVKIQSVIVILVATWLYGLPGFIWASVGAFAIGLWPFVRLVGLQFFQAARVRTNGAFRDIAKYSVLGNVLNTIGKYADLYVLGLFAPDPIQVGYYALATVFVIPGSVVTSSIQTITTPYLAENSNRRRWFIRSVIRTQLQTVGIAVLAAIGVRIAAGILVAVLYDPAYAASLDYLNVLLIFYVLRSGYAVIASGHIALGLTRYNFIASAVMAPLALGLTYMALQLFGFDGVAWAKVAAAAVMVVVYVGLARRAFRTGFDRS